MTGAGMCVRFQTLYTTLMCLNCGTYNYMRGAGQTIANYASFSY